MIDSLTFRKCFTLLVEVNVKFFFLKPFRIVTGGARYNLACYGEMLRAA